MMIRLKREIFFIVVLGAVFTTFSSQSQTIYFYSAESNINNFKFLKMEFDRYLSDFGSFTFQPFANIKTFEKFIDSNFSGIYLLSSWHYKLLSTKKEIMPFLVGTHKSETTMKLVLSTQKGIGDIEQLLGGKIASSGSEGYTRRILEEVFGLETSSTLDTIDILAVPKDIDAIMGVGFGLVEAALTTKNSLEKLKKNQFYSIRKTSPIGGGCRSILAHSDEFTIQERGYKRISKNH